MLFFLTGDIQIGKTRWLEGAIRDLTDKGVPVYGVVAPGRWIERDGGFEKTGIDNVMLPQGSRVSFADAAGKGWAFHQEAIERVNDHFRDMGRPDRPGLLVVDELGWMELLDGKGLTEAMKLLDEGATDAFPHALVIVRDRLLDCAQDRFAAVDWAGTAIIGPNAQSRTMLMAAYEL